MKLYLLLLLTFLCFTMPCFSIEIPLDNTAIVNGNKSRQGNIAYIDVEKLFDEHPMKQRLIVEFQAEVNKRRNEINEFQKSIEELQKIVISTTTEIDNAKTQLKVLILTSSGIAQMKTDIMPSTTDAQNQEQFNLSQTTVSASLNNAVITAKENEIKEKEAAVESLNREIEKKNIELKDKIRQNKDELCRLEERHSAAVMADLYKILEKMAVEENLAIIMDKNNILYGQNVEDLTDKVKQRLQGR